jgi:outer membrane murein-binding lipoprotein Lpp
MSFFSKNKSKFYLGVAFVLGLMLAPSGVSQEKVDSLNTKIETQQKKIKSLESKLKEAEPYFELSATERENKLAQAKLDADKLKAAEEKKEADKKKAAEVAAQKAIAAKTKIISAGKYLIGSDIEPGRYNIEYISGTGNILGSGMNHIMGGQFTTETYNGAELVNGAELEVTMDLKIKLIPKN